MISFVKFFVVYFLCWEEIGTRNINRETATREWLLLSFTFTKGTQFDPEFAQIMLDMINSGEVSLHFDFDEEDE